MEKMEVVDLISDSEEETNASSRSNTGKDTNEHNVKALAKRSDLSAMAMDMPHMSLDLVSEANPIGLVEPRKVAECNSAMGAVSNSMNNFYIGTPKGGVNAELGELVHMFTKLDISKECTISFDVPSSAEDVPSRAEDAEDDVEGKAEMGDAFSSGHVSDGISRGDGSDERKDGQKSLFGKNTSSEIDNMFNFLNDSVETYDRDSREIYNEHLSEVRTALKALNNQLETKSNFEKQQELKAKIQHLSGLECLLTDFLAKFPEHTFANSESNNFAVHFVAVLSPRSNDGSPPTLRGWLILPTSMATKKFFSDQCRKGNIIFCHDIGLLNAHTSTEGMFKTLRKGAKNLMMEYGTIPNKDDDWYASMTAYGLMTRLAPLVHAASLEHSFPFEYAVYPVIDFFGTMNQYTGNLLEGHGDLIINYAGGRPVGQNPSLGRGLPPMRDVPCPQFQQNGAPRVQQRDEPQRAPNQLGGGGGGGGGPPILVPPVRHEQDPGGLAERFLDLPMALKALVTLARVQCLEDAFTPFSKSGYRIVIWSRKTEQTVKEAYLLLNQCEEEELGEIKSILMKRGFEAAGREQAKQRIKAIVRVGFNAKVQENFDKIFADSEKHPCRPLRVSVEEQSAIVGRAKKRRTDSAPFLAKAMDTPFMTPAQLQTGKNVLIANHDDGKQDGNNLFQNSSSSSPNWKRKAPSWQSPSVARPQQQQRQQQQRQKMPPPQQQQQSGRQTENTQDSDTRIWPVLVDFKCQKCPAEISGTLGPMDNEAQPFTFRVSHTVNGEKCINYMNVGTEKGRRMLFNGIVNFPPEAKKAVFDGLVEKAIPAYKEKIRASPRIGSKYEPWDEKREERYELTLEDVKKSFSAHMSSGGRDMGVKDHTVKNPTNFTCINCEHCMQEVAKYSFVIEKDKYTTTRIGHPSTDSLNKRNSCKTSTNWTQKKDAELFVSICLKEVPLQEKIKTLEALLAKFVYIKDQKGYERLKLRNTLQKIKNNIDEQLKELKKSAAESKHETG